MIVEIVALAILAAVVIAGLYIFNWSVDNVLIAMGITILVLLGINFAAQKGYI